MTEGDLKRAIEDARKILADAETSLGPIHPVVADCLENYANLLTKSGAPKEETAPLYERVSSIRYSDDLAAPILRKPANFQESKSGKNLVAVSISAIILVLISGAGIWYFNTKKTTPANIKTKNLAVEKSKELQEQESKVFVPKPILTFKDFETSEEYSKLKLRVTEIFADNRIYQNSANSLIVALQVDNGGVISRVRLLPLQSVCPEATGQSTIARLSLDLVYGNGASQKLPKARQQIKISTQEFCREFRPESGRYKASLVTDSIDGRTGLDLQTTYAKPWTASKPLEPIVNSPAPTETAESNETEKLQDPCAPVKTSLKETQSKLAKLEKQFSENESLLKTEISSKQSILDDLGIAQKKIILRDETIDNLRTAQEQLRAEKFIVRPALPRTQVPIIPSFDQSDDTDVYASEIPGFLPKTFRKDVEARISNTLRNPPSSLKVDILPNFISHFTINSDGSPDQIEIDLRETSESQNDSELRIKILEQAKQLILDSGPFRPVSIFSIQAMRMSVEILRTNGSELWQISARYARKPEMISSASSRD